MEAAETRDHRAARAQGFHPGMAPNQRTSSMWRAVGEKASAFVVSTECTRARYASGGEQT